jgi:LysM repeat protein
MRWRMLLLVSLAANILVAAAWLLSARNYPFPARRARNVVFAPAQIKTNVVIRRQFFSWEEVESTNYATYVANLRDIDCPEQTIRDIIIADVNSLYARKRLTEVITPAQQWWRTTPDTNVLQAAAERLRELEGERRALLTSLLGPDWEQRGPPATNAPARLAAALPLDGPVLGALEPEARQAVLDISARSQERMQAYADARQKDGKPLDPVELARLRQQTRDELAKALSPQQVEEFLLRYSQNANGLRAELGQLKFFNATADEFRAIFRAADSIDMQLALLAGSTDPGSAPQRDALQQQRENAIKLALGTQRFEQYQLLHDAGFRDAFAAALQAGSPDAAPALYEINQAAAQEQARIRANTNLTAGQLAIESKKAELDQLKAVAQALGQDLPPEPPPLPPKPAPVKIHMLANGEGLDFLARLYGVNPGDIRAANPNVDFSKLKAGVSVSIPIKLLPPVPYAPPQ